MDKSFAALKGPHLVMGTSASSDIQTTIMSLMRELSKTNKFINKNDIYTMISKQFDFTTFDRAMNRLAEDGKIVPTYDDIYTLQMD